MSIRLRLTLWYTLVLSALLGVIGFAGFNLFAAALQDNVDRQLEETAAQVFSVSTVSALGQVRIPVEANVFRGTGLYLQVIDPSGRIVNSSQMLSGLERPLHPEAIGAAPAGDMVWMRDDVYVDGAHLRVLTVPIGTPRQVLGYLQVGQSVESNDEALSQLTRILLLGWLAGVLLAGAGGAFLARQALRPIDAITHTALAITQSGDLSRRIRVPAARDEVGRLAGTFNGMLQRLESLFKAQQRFTADISHELRTPLTTIRGNIDLMRRTRVADDASLDAAQSEIDRMTRLVGDLLLLAQADAGLPIRREPVALDAVVVEVFEQMRVVAHDVNVGLACDESVTVRGDPDRLKQLVLNLVSNAVRYTPAGGKVTLGLERRGGWAQLSVSDTGPGIPPEHVPHLFERFYRVDKSRSRSEAGNASALSGGAGLGLSIAQWIAHSHDGRIEVRSQVGQGTTFTVYLPELKA
jgi:heavy metal sensor kinase